MRENGKRLGRLQECPICRRTVDPIVVANYNAVRHIPARTVVKCPSQNHKTEVIWYIPDHMIEELPVADTA